jgi:hypothetical protein
MANVRLSENAALEKRRRERSADGGALVDLRIDVVYDGELLVSAGGRWDRRLADFDGEAETAVEIEPHPGQLKSILWFIDWLGVHAGRRDEPPPMPEEGDDEISTDPAEVFSALLAGGRRGGKTWIAALMCAIYAVQFPGAIVWVVNPSDSKHDEVRRYMSLLLAPEWITRETQADGWELVNGSAIMLKSAYVGADPDAIKEGEANLVWMNEGQKMAERVYVVARGAISDHSGLVLVCANPPVEAKDQQWVGDFAADAAALRRASHYIHLNPLDNPKINRRALLAMSRELDERSFRIEVLGEFLGPEDAVAYNWIRTPGGNERAMPQPTWVRDGNSIRQIACPVTGLLDVTSEFLELEEEGENLTDLVGLDVQVHPHIGGPVYRFYAPPEARVHRDTVIAWIVDEIVVEGGDEVDWSAQAYAQGYKPSSTLIICDATGEYQHSRRRNADSPPPDWKGKGSFDIVRQEGFQHIVPPSRRFRKKNPDIVDRVRAFTSMIAAGIGGTKKRRLFADRDRAPKTCRSIREWKTVHGKPSRSDDAAHLGDASSYPMVRLFPRILRSGKPGGVDKVTQLVDKPASLAALLGPSPTPRRIGRPPRGL